MICMHSIGVIGDYDSICGFSAVGFHIFPVESAQQAGEELKRLANSGYGIIYITEPFMDALPSDCALYDGKAIPCIVPVPACTGVTGFGISRLKRYVEQAVGSDIIFDKD